MGCLGVASTQVRHRGKRHLKSVLVYGWYGHGNLGDESFRQSIEDLWPDSSFVFWDSLDQWKQINADFDAVMIGGGSFLDQRCPHLSKITLPIAYVGVGVGQSIHPDNLAGLKRAKAIVLRDEASAARLPENVTGTVAADLFMARRRQGVCFSKKNQRVTVLLSEHFAPRGVVPEWFANSWAHHVRELAQVCDELVESGHEVEFLPMCGEPEWDDSRAAAMVISRMVHARDCLWYHRGNVNELEMLKAIEGSSLVITQRLHGAIFSTALGCPFVAICGHDKMRDFCVEVGWKHKVELYASSARLLREAAASAMEENPFILDRYTTEARERWRVASATVKERLSL